MLLYAFKFFSIVQFVNCIAGEKSSVPAIIWSSKKLLNEKPNVSALQYISYPSFVANYLGLFDDNNIVLFLQDALSIEDLSSHPKEFHDVSEFMESDDSIYLPNVETPSHIVHDFPIHGYHVSKLDPGSAISELKLDENGKNLLIVKLPSTITNPSRKNALRKSDEVIANVVSKIGNYRDFTYIYTAQRPSLEIDGLDHLRVSRSLQQSYGSSSKELHNGTCILVFLRNNMTIGPGNYPIPESSRVKIDDIPSECGETEQFILLKYSNVEIANNTYTKLDIRLKFKKVGRDWSENGAVLYTMTKVQSKTYILEMIGSDLEGIPLGMSFACSKKLIYQQVNQSKKATEDFYLQINGIQVQAFMKNSNKFGPAWDCIGFFTVPILMSIFAFLLFLAITLWGLYMLSDIKTMDRFDDPKGTPFIVPNASD